MIDFIPKLIDTLVFLRTEVINGLSFLMITNYEVVSFLVRCLLYAFYGLQSLISGIYWTMIDFYDQYGDFCISVLKGVFATAVLMGQSLVMIGHVIWIILTTLIDIVIFLIKCPIVIGKSILAIFRLLQSIPAKALDLTIDGLGMMGQMVVDACVAVGSGFVTATKSITDTVIGIATWKKIDGEFLNQEAIRTTRLIGLEVAIGVIICIGSWWVIKNRRWLIGAGRREVSG